ncbi:MAG: ArsR family transcriptional regulator [Bdellovibrio sp.]|nr:MAG: ArsR family transcriptional regulator [Bdellovibrio sp.]
MIFILNSINIMLMEIEKLFGNQTAAKCLIFLGRYDEGTAPEIAGAFGLERPLIFLQLRKLEDAGIVASRKISNIRLYSLNPRSGIRNELKALLEKYIELNMPHEKYKDFYLIRRRPRRPGKALKGAYEK